MICSYCHTENKEGAKFCNECGKILVPVSENADRTPEKELAENEASLSGAIEDAHELSDTISENTSVSPAELIELAALELKSLAQDTEPTSTETTDTQPTQSESAATESTSTPSKDYAHATDKTAPLDPTPPAAFAPTKANTQPAANDLSGIDECLVDSSYVPPQKAWRGSTIEMEALKDDGSKKSHESTERRSQSKPVRQPLQKKSRYAIIIVSGLVVAILLLIYITYALELWGGKIIPDVNGKTQVDAEYLLTEKGFTVETNEVHSDETQGIVLYVTPQVGDRTDSETPVIINVSIPRIIPDVAGAQYDDVVEALHEQGISNITTKEERSSDEAGLVRNITPQPGSIVKAADEVVLTVATPFAVPNVLGLTYEEAQSILEEAGYDTTVIYDSREMVSVTIEPGFNRASGAGSVKSTILFRSDSRES